MASPAFLPAQPPADRPSLTDLRQLCISLRAALSAEARAAAQHTVSLGEGVRLATTGAGCTYRFALATPIDAEAGKPVVVRIHHRELEATIARVADDAVDLVLGGDDSGYAVDAGAELRLGTAWLIERLRTRVTGAFEVGTRAPSAYNLQLALLTLGVGDVEVARIGPVPEFEDAARPLSEEQVHAIATAFRSPLTVIPAPGGTGKTLTLGALVEAYQAAGKRTLVTALTNKAVDLTLLQACGRLCGKPGFQDGMVVRVGDDAGPELRSEYESSVVLDALSARIRAQLQKKIVEQSEVVDRLARALTRVQQGVRDDAHESTLRISLSAARSKLRDLRREMRDFAQSLTAQAQVVGATLSRVFLDPSLGRFDVVIVDECSMALPPAIFYAAGLARDHVVLAGDPAQLSTPVLSHGPDRAWLTEDVFKRLGVIEAMRAGFDIPHITPLTEQRRCAESLCAVQRELWYGPSLRTARSVIERERRRHNVVFGTSALCYVDTSALDARAYRPFGRTFANDEHARVILGLVRYLDSAGEIPERAEDEMAILALSHYRGQSRNLRHVLAAYRLRGVSARTVHRSQGAEATTTLFDLTLTRSQPASASIMTAMRPEDEGSRLLCTALTRARSRFVFIGDLDWIEHSVSPRTVLGRLVAYLREDGYSIPLGEVLPG